MPPKAISEVIGDTTDPKGTLRPNLPPEITIGDHFIPLDCPLFGHTLHIPSGTTSPFQFFSLYITKEDIDLLVKTTNERGALRKEEKAEKGWKSPRSWKDVSVGEIYIYLGILVLIGLHPEPKIEDYWSQKSGMPLYKDISLAMAGWRWEAINTNFHISSSSSKKETPFEKVRIDKNWIKIG